jgi:hypothetical protein
VKKKVLFNMGACFKLSNNTVLIVSLKLTIGKKTGGPY